MQDQTYFYTEVHCKFSAAKQFKVYPSVRKGLYHLGQVSYTAAVFFGDPASPSHSEYGMLVTPCIKFAVTHLYTWVERASM